MAYPGIVIDMHTHIFNAHCIPLNGVLKQRGVPYPFNEALASLFNLLTGKLDFYEHGGEYLDFFRELFSKTAIKDYAEDFFIVML